jgi:hypothetical protein
MIEVYQMYRYAQKTRAETEILQNIRSHMKKYPLWHAYGLTGITISSLVILLIKSFNLVVPILNI